jgi:thiamine-monophosphate kinase
MTDFKHETNDIKQLGEFGLIERLTNGIVLKNDSSVYGVGDDAAVLNYREKEIVVSTDLLTEGIHFNLMYSPLKHLGYKAAIVNFSDIYAMNAIPKQLLISLALSVKFTVPMIDDLYEGIKLACEKYGVDLVGGDTSSSLTGLHIAVTIIGEAEKKKLTYRNGAKINDLICVSGDLGSAYMGLQLLEREKKIFEEDNSIQPDLSGSDYILERQLKPEARRDVIDLLEKTGIIPNAMIDISDGLSSDLLHICKQSSVGCKLYTDKIPIHPETIRMADDFEMEPLVAALNGGEDYELLFTVPVSEFDKLKAQPGISIIGHITDQKEGFHLITPNNEQIELKAQGWNGVK